MYEFTAITAGLALMLAVYLFIWPLVIHSYMRKQLDIQRQILSRLGPAMLPKNRKKIIQNEPAPKSREDDRTSTFLLIAIAIIVACAVISAF